jgi:hypothetical protein
MTGVASTFRVSLGESGRLKLELSTPDGGCLEVNL